MQRWPRRCAAVLRHESSVRHPHRDTLVPVRPCEPRRRSRLPTVPACSDALHEDGRSMRCRRRATWNLADERSFGRAEASRVDAHENGARRRRTTASGVGDVGERAHGRSRRRRRRPRPAAARGRSSHACAHGWNDGARRRADRARADHGVLAASCTTSSNHDDAARVASLLLRGRAARRVGGAARQAHRARARMRPPTRRGWSVRRRRGAGRPVAGGGVRLMR